MIKVSYEECVIVSGGVCSCFCLRTVDYNLVNFDNIGEYRGKFDREWDCHSRCLSEKYLDSVCFPEETTKSKDNVKVMPGFRFFPPLFTFFKK
jgi:hypothetical protein